MKQNLLFTLCLLAIAGLLQAQTSTSTRIINKPLLLDRTVKIASLHLFNTTEKLSLTGNPKTAPSITTRTAGQAPGSIVIGTTYYDLQTGLSVARRVLRRDDGTLTAVWTGSPDQAFAQRGTMYAYFDGTSWTCTNPTTRLEPLRTGWPNIDMLNGNEFIVSHNGANYSLEQGYSGGIGQCAPSDWTFSQSGASASLGNASGQGSIWPRMAIDGNNIVVVTVFADTSVHLAGVSAPVVYAHSSDGGATWAANNTFPGYNSTTNSNSTQDQYAIDANNGKMSAVVGFLGDFLLEWNSTDGGATWTENKVDTLPPFDTWPVDTVMDSNDGTMSVVVDDNSKTHVAYALGQVVKILNSGTPEEDLLIGSLGLKYWEEGMTSPVWVVNPDSLPSVFDANGDGQYSVGVLGTLSQGNATDNYNRYAGINPSLLTEPSISYDTLGDVFITFMLAHDGDTTFDGQTYHNVYLASHQANAGWSASDWTISDITPTVFVEDAFPTSARKTTDSVRLEYQEDLIPGTAVNNGQGSSSNLNNINYIAAANPYWVTGINNVKAIQGIDVKQNFPNPFNKSSVIQITMNKSAKLNFKVTDVLGKVVMQQNLNYSSGTHTITINRDQLSAGVYFYTVQAGNEQITNKMIVE